jgi:hypothetical protein
MTKKTIGLSIDENILQKAKDTIPNLSEFFEECLKHYFGYADGTFPIGNINDITDKIGKLQVELFLINENYDVEESRQEAKKFEEDKAWRFLWNDYRIRLIPDEQLLAEAEEKLQMHGETLEDLLDELYEVKDDVDTEEWDKVYEWWKKVRK